MHWMSQYIYGLFLDRVFHYLRHHDHFHRNHGFFLLYRSS
jgi:hypothetical protein